MDTLVVTTPNCSVTDPQARVDTLLLDLCGMKLPAPTEDLTPLIEWMKAFLEAADDVPNAVTFPREEILSIFEMAGFFPRMCLGEDPKNKQLMGCWVIGQGLVWIRGCPELDPLVAVAHAPMIISFLDTWKTGTGMWDDNNRRPPPVIPWNPRA